MRRVRHKKRGTEYEVIGQGIFQIAGDTSIADEEPVVVYRGDDQRIWVRPVAEFEDGRFEDVPPRPGRVVGEDSQGVWLCDLDCGVEEMRRCPKPEACHAWLVQE